MVVGWTIMDETKIDDVSDNNIQQHSECRNIPRECHGEWHF